MNNAYADVIVDISGDKLDKTFQYRIPESLQGKIKIGSPVIVPFGKGGRTVSAYVVGLSDQPELDVGKIKEIESIPNSGVSVEQKLIALAGWMKQTYGSTMNQALKTVLPMKQEIRQKKKKRIVLNTDHETAALLLEEYEKKHRTARARLLHTLLKEQELDYSKAVKELKVTASVLRPMEEAGVLRIEEEQVYRFPAMPDYQEFKNPPLSPEQEKVADAVMDEYEQDQRPCLIHGITGSGKTRIYMELIERMIVQGKQVIVLIPEIALTYQVIWQFRQRFGEKSAVLHSKMSMGERWDAFEAARKGMVSVMVGPRSALFTPFPNLGMIIIDEEHESSYKSEGSPRYHARETAQERCWLEGAQLVLGSATPSLESYFRCETGSYRLFTLTQRFGSGALPQVYTVDMREELKEGNTSVFSRKLQMEIKQRLEQKEQVILFLNRRGYAGFVSCRNCGYVLKCPHCDVSLSQHNNKTMVCHYCGYTVPQVTTCPDCGSRYIGGFRAGTQQIEELVKKMFPQAKVLRMDLDTTRQKDGHSRILSAFANQEADILIGTQMIIKGHDFPKVTLVGVLAADLSLYAEDYRSSERTFQLIVQAVGRAGRGEKAGTAVIQTYHPEHYSIKASSVQDYPAFYREEMGYRMLMDYPPAAGMMAVMGSGESEEQLSMAMSFIKKYIETIGKDNRLSVIGPTDAAVSKVQDRYRKVLYLKHPEGAYLKYMLKQTERYIEINPGFRTLSIQFDMQG